jgi:ADP-ribosylglycohydrolase
MSIGNVGRIILAEPSEPSPKDRLYEKISGALLGGAIADALGWPTEFAKRPEDLERLGVEYPVQGFQPWHKRSGGRFLTRIDNIQPGEYSDDSQLTLCVARSINSKGRVENHYFAKQELPHWIRYARGAGATVTAAAKAAGRKRSDWRWNYFTFTRGRHQLDYRGAGANGAAMRSSPIALANVNEPEQAAIETWKNAITTHGHPRAIIGALVFVEALRRLVANNIKLSADAYVSGLIEYASSLEVPESDPDIGYWLARWNQGPAKFQPIWDESRREMTQLLLNALNGRSLSLRQTYEALGCLDPATKGAGTVTTAAALAIFLRFGNKFDKAVLAAANELGSDTDTIGAMAGSLTGGWLGYTAIREEWATMMADYTYFNKVAEALTDIALCRASKNPLRLDVQQDRDLGSASNILTQLDRQDVVERRLVWHPLLQRGWVTKVESQEVGKNRARVVMATVHFDIGQTCKFTSFKSMTSTYRSATKLKRSKPVRPPGNY